MDCNSFICPVKERLLYNLEKPEILIVAGIIYGMSNREIALSIHYTIEAVQNRITDIYKKLLIYEGSGKLKRGKLKDYYHDELIDVLNWYLSEFPEEEKDFTATHWSRMPFVWDKDVPEKCRDSYLESVKFHKDEFLKTIRRPSPQSKTGSSEITKSGGA